MTNNISDLALHIEDLVLKMNICQLNIKKKFLISWINEVSTNTPITDLSELTSEEEIAILDKCIYFKIEEQIISIKIKDIIPLDCMEIRSLDLSLGETTTTIVENNLPKQVTYSAIKITISKPDNSTLQLENITTNNSVS